MINKFQATRKVVCKPFNDRIAASESWQSVSASCVAGIAFAKDGVHLTKVWPDGDPQPELITWKQIQPSELSVLAAWVFRWVDDVFIDNFSPGLNERQQKLKQLVVEKLFDVVSRGFSARVSLGNNPTGQKPGAKLTEGKMRSVQAACFGFEQKLKALLRTNYRLRRKRLASPDRSSGQQ